MAILIILLIIGLVLVLQSFLIWKLCQIFENFQAKTNVTHEAPTRKIVHTPVGTYKVSSKHTPTILDDKKAFEMEQKGSDCPERYFAHC